MPMIDNSQHLRDMGYGSRSEGIAQLVQSILGARNQKRTEGIQNMELDQKLGGAGYSRTDPKGMIAKFMNGGVPNYEYTGDYRQDPLKQAQTDYYNAQSSLFNGGGGQASINPQTGQPIIIPTLPQLTGQVGNQPTQVSPTSTGIPNSPTGLKVSSVSTSTDKYGRPQTSMTYKPDEPSAEEQKQQMESVQGKKMASNNVENVSGALRELAQTYADAYKEGGVGNRGKQALSDAALWWGGKAGDQFKNTAAFPGQKVEVVSRMMPLLTQQGDKPGSVRLVQAIFEKLSETLPDANTGPESASKMMEKTIRNMYRFARSTQLLGVDSFEGMSDDELDVMANKAMAIGSRINLDKSEDDALNYLISSSLEPIRQLSSNDPMEGRTATNPQTKEKLIYRGGQWQKM